MTGLTVRIFRGTIFKHSRLHLKLLGGFPHLKYVCSINTRILSIVYFLISCFLLLSCRPFFFFFLDFGVFFFGFLRKSAYMWTMRKEDIEALICKRCTLRQVE